jgi:hypothetical protein
MLRARDRRGGQAEATRVNRGRVIGLYDVDPDRDPEIDFGNASAFLWTPQGGMVQVRQRSRPAGIDAAGRIAVVDDVDIAEGASENLARELAAGRAPRSPPFTMAFVPRSLET